MRLLLASLVAATALAGCVTDLSLEVPAPTGSLTRLALQSGATAEGLAPLVWEGKRLVGEEKSTMPGQSVERKACTPTSCDLVPFRVDIPAGFWTANPGAVEVSIEWEHQESDYESLDPDASLPMAHYLGLPQIFMHLRVLTPDGTLVADGVDSFHFASVAIIPSLAPGDYVAEIQARWGTGAYRGVVQIEPDGPAASGELLPDLVIMPPSELTLEHPIGREGPDPVSPAGRKGCDPDEAIEGGSVRCLRFATGFGNAGPGRLEMRLPAEEAQKAIAIDGRWTQRVYDAEGGHRDLAATPGSYHKVHGHYHILGLDVSQVYAYDLDAAERGIPVGKGSKTGFCPVDSALIEPLGLGTTLPVAYAGCCYMWGICQLDWMDTRGEVIVGLSAGWYDVYPWWRADQYVDIGAAPDGVYELETCANPQAYMLEKDLGNNCASMLFRLTGSKVETIGAPLA